VSETVIAVVENVQKTKKGLGAHFSFSPPRPRPLPKIILSSLIIPRQRRVHHGGGSRCRYAGAGTFSNPQRPAFDFGDIATPDDSPANAFHAGMLDAVDETVKTPLQCRDHRSRLYMIGS
jgi:hypothetical protein